MTAAAERSAGGWGVVGASRAIATLQRMIDADHLPHALLLSGPPQTGKHAVAMGLARALNCTGAAARPCGACRDCRRIAAGRHADVETVSPGGFCRVAEHEHRNSVVIGICQVRRLEMAAATRPYEGRARVFIIDPADALTGEAADAFLKTLEEPPASVTFVLVSARAALLPDTVRSRCRTVAVEPLAAPALASWLQEAQGLDADAALTLARLSRGRVGAALEALGEGDARAMRAAQAEEIRRLSEAGDAERLAYAEAVSGRGASGAESALRALAAWRAWWRDLLLAGVGCAEAVAERDALETLRAESRRYRAAEVVTFLEEVQRVEGLLRRGITPRLAMDALLLAVPRARGPRRDAA